MRKMLCVILVIIMIVSQLPASVVFAEGESEIYAEAEAFLAEGDLYNAATTFYSIAEYSDAKARSFEIWHQITGYRTIAGKHTVFYAVKNDGTLYEAKSDGGRYYTAKSHDASYWKEIVSIAVGGKFYDEFVAGLKPDGTVMCNRFNCDDWKDIVYIAAGAKNTLFGIKADGTVLVAGEGEECEGVSQWTDIVTIASGAESSGGHTNPDVVKDCSTIGLKADGTLVATGSNKDGQKNTRGRENIVAISFFNDIVYLMSDGTVECYGGSHLYNGYKGNEKEWKNVKLICDGVLNVCCVDSEGVLHSARSISDGDDITNPTWGDVVELWNTYENGHGSIIIGLCEDGRLKFESVSGNEEDIEQYVRTTQEDLGEWKNIRLPDTYYVSTDRFFSDEAYIEVSDGEQWAIDMLKQLDSDYHDLYGVNTTASDVVEFSAKVRNDRYSADIIGWAMLDNSAKAFDWQFDASPESVDLYKHVVFQSLETDVNNKKITPFYIQLWRCGKAISTLAGITNPPNGNIDILLDSRDEPQQIGDWIYTMILNEDESAIIIHGEFLSNVPENESSRFEDETPEEGVRYDDNGVFIEKNTEKDVNDENKPLNDNSDQQLGNQNDQAQSVAAAPVDNSETEHIESSRNEDTETKAEKESNDLSAVKSSTGLDLTQMTVEELLSLRDTVNLAIVEADEWKEVKVPNGVWAVGNDIPEGKWTVTVGDPCDVWLSVGKTLNDRGTDLTGNYDYWHLRGKDYVPYIDGYITTIDIKLEKGDYVSIKEGHVFFSPFVGKQHLSFYDQQGTAQYHDSSWNLYNLSYQELIAIRSIIDMVIWEAKEWLAVKVPNGVWTVGEDIPEGKWTISVGDPCDVWLSVGDTLNERGTDLTDHYDYWNMRGKDYSFYNEGDITSIVVQLKEGDYVVVKEGYVVFSPNTGNPSLGF